MPNCTPSWIASQSQNPDLSASLGTGSELLRLWFRLRELGRDSLLKDCPPSLFLPNMGHTWTPNYPTYFLPIPMTSTFSLLSSPRRLCPKLFCQVLSENPPCKECPKLGILGSVNGFRFLWMRAVPCYNVMGAPVAKRDESTLSEGRKEGRKEGRA